MFAFMLLFHFQSIMVLFASPNNHPYATQTLPFDMRVTPARHLLHQDCKAAMFVLQATVTTDSAGIPANPLLYAQA